VIEAALKDTGGAVSDATGRCGQVGHSASTLESKIGGLEKFKQESFQGLMSLRDRITHEVRPLLESWQMQHRSL